MTGIKKELLEWIITIAAAGALAFIINIFGGFAVVEGPSMMPTLIDKDILVRVNYLAKEPKRGDIIAFKTDMTHPWKIYRMLGVKKALVKRIIGLPGDHIVIKDGLVYVNELQLQENQLLDGTTSGEVDVVVTEGNLFVMGDNRQNSNDSRGTVGLVSIKSIIGRMAYRIYPFNTMEKFQ
jgi:signal peptidase I